MSDPVRKAKGLPRRSGVEAGRAGSQVWIRMVRAGWKPALWGVFLANVLLWPLLLPGVGGASAALPDWMPTHPAALIALHAIASAVALPNTPFCVAAGLFFGLGRGMLFASLGAFLGSLAAFAAGRLFRRLLSRRFRRSPIRRFSRVESIFAALGGAGFRTVALTRLSPLLPFPVQNFGWAVTRVRFRAYALGSLLAVPVGASFFAHLGAAGSAGASLATDRFRWSAVLTVIGVVATFLLIRRLSRFADRALRDRIAGGADGPP